MSKMILHLDDEEAIRDIVGEVLKAQGYRVLSVATPRDAIAAAREEVPNLVISPISNWKRPTGCRPSPNCARSRPPCP